ncbi:MAG TPA: hypothetical protein VJA66_02445 [Thermoanaerobaculia bacterium]
MAGDDTEAGRPAELVPGLTHPRTLSIERFLIRMRGGTVTQSAWRLLATADQGQGTIIFVEASAAENFYRGDGVFLGWPQDRLEAAYRALLPKPDEPDFEMHQLG